ncbi:type III PLP-dependent enzyme [Acetobacter peroxydans]|jgi:ornithine decarboxylase|uniref:type III PLP-dependent enzyme n=1 Tax=Acetobacter peroxydans TaxID=104098 RepID=UPI0023559EE8|nr:type III PLP-dependent enzyme [Acetobacter peroxydans]MCH4143266.1 type III PLP-dependent enzyme [Acetobacter peroxydans]MCI1394322.1 type III PLP-dependent enzyme [Acetobacter peroxydans]MCI1411733.1 type III PLP-dependent enzyme [Acetobacter peroxydans]MCI1439337.1 type III PLP-dependent enzyme [Acetobacter peroxydans]MCI1567051.1 type III PLP-dependent enzyme [Acetobacter peroxydans]
MNPKITRFIAEKNPATPCLVVDVDEVEARYRALGQALPQARIYYAVKANPARPILDRLVGLGSCFDAASWEEVSLCLQAGADPAAISFGNTVKKVSAIRAAYEAGVRMFVFDCREELEKLARHAPGSRVYCRLLVDNYAAEWPLSRKFGTTVESARDLMLAARDMGLDPYGLSFHVGSQQLSAEAYEVAIARVASLFTDLSAAGLDLRMINLGGGFPIRYREDVPEIDHFAEAIFRAMTEHFGNAMPDMLVEPGRFIVGEAGVVHTEVVLVSARGRTDGLRWVYLDIGRFGGLAETENESIRYAIRTGRDGAPSGRVALAGPTCDGADILYEKTRYDLPLDLESGEVIDLLGTGAYVSTYCSTRFNGFAPLAEHYI